MINKILNFKWLVLLFAFSLTSCLDDLNVSPKDDDDFSAEKFYSSEEAYKQFLAKLYAGFTLSGQTGPAGNSDIQGIDEGFGQYLRGVWQLQELSTDEAIVSWGDENLPELNVNGWTSNNRFVRATYSRVFYQVGLANEFLRNSTDEMLSKRNVSDAVKNEVKTYRAEARFIRAFAYYNGIDLFGNVPFATENDKVGVLPRLSSRTETFNYLISELKAIESELKAPRTNEYGRVDQAAAWMLLAKLYLNAEVFTSTPMYAQAQTYIDKVIASNYKLASSYKNLFLADNDTNGAQEEIILPFRADGLRTKTWGGTSYLAHASTGSWNTEIGIDGGWFGLAARKQFADKFQDLSGTSDNRAIFKTTNPLEITKITNFFGDEGLKVAKFKNITSSGANGSNLTHVDIDFPALRLGDAYLMYAELAARGIASKSQALTYIKALRTRANNAEVLTEADITLDFILDERARELYWEGHRRQDLIRFNKYISGYNWQWKGNSLNGGDISSHLKLYPVPNQELTINSNLKQNPGY